MADEQAKDAQIGFISENFGSIVVTAIGGMIAMMFAVSGTLISVWSQTGLNTENIAESKKHEDQSGKDRWTKTDAQAYAERLRDEMRRRDDVIRELGVKIAAIEGLHTIHVDHRAREPP